MVIIRSTKIVLISFVLIVVLFFIPMIPAIGKAMENFNPLTLALYWVSLTVISIILGLATLRGVER